MNSTTHVKTLNQGFDASALMANKAEPLEKVTKVTYKVIEFAQVTCRVIFNVSSEAFSVLHDRLKDTSEVLEVVQIGGRYHELFCPDENGQYFFKTNTWQKIADRVFLTVHVTFKTIGFCSYLGLMTLGRMGAFAIGQLTVFKLVTEVLVCFSSSFGLWDNKNKLVKSYKDLKVSVLKVEKWKHRPELLDQIRQGDKAVLAKLAQGYEEKSVKVMQDIQKLEQKLDRIKSYSTLLEKNEKEEALPLPETLVQKLKKQTVDELVAKYAEKTHEVTDKIAILQFNQKKYDDRLLDISSKEHQALADKLSNKDIDYQVLKWETNKENEALSITKTWLNVAKAIFKLAVVTLALCLIATNVWTTPFLLSVLALGIFHDGIGLSKILLDEYRKAKPMPLKPVSLAASAA